MQSSLSSSWTSHGFISNSWYVAACLRELPLRREVSVKICDLDVRLLWLGADSVTAHTVDATALHCVIQEGLVWIFTGNDTPEKGPPEFGGPKGKVRFVEKVTIPAHQDDAIYGLLDPAHTPFVHKSPIWRGNGILKEKKKTFVPSELGFTMTPHAPINSDIYNLIGGSISVKIVFRLPGLRAEYISNRKHTVLGLTALTPIDEQSTALRQIFYWNSPVLNLVRPFARLVARPFLEQDVRIMALRKENAPYAGKGMLLGDSDQQFLWYLKLKRSWEAAQNTERGFTNPLEPATLRWRT
ncbi:MAG: hypothetical protein ACK4M6_00120 [Hyphomonas sp.]